MGMVDGALIDKRSNFLSSIGLLLLAIKLANMKNVEPLIGNKHKQLNSIATEIAILGTILFYFQFESKENCVNLSIITSQTPLIITYKDTNDMNLNYQPYCKILKGPADGYSEMVEMTFYSPFLLFPQYDILAQINSKTQIKICDAPQYRSICALYIKQKFQIYQMIRETR